MNRGRFGRGQAGIPELPQTQAVSGFTHTPCCTAHGVDMDCATYRRTHFVEVGYCCRYDERRRRGGDPS